MNRPISSSFIVHRSSFIVLLLLPFALWADETPRGSERIIRRTEARHFILTAEHTLRPNEQADLAAEGVEIQHVLPNNRYLVRTATPDDVAEDPRVRSIESFSAAKKIDRSAYREAAGAHTFARVRLVFHDDISFADAQRAIERVGGMVDQQLASDFEFPHRLQARIPFAALSELADDDGLLVIYGPPLKIKSDNAISAQVSHVTPLFTAPYNLSGAGVVVSEFELAQADATHPDFGGRLTTHLTGGTSSDALHATHVAGTIIGSGMNDPTAKGMAPAAILHEFDARPDFPIVLDNKQNSLAPLSIVADNNSWGFQLGWQNEGTEVWYGGEDYFGGYDDFYSSPYDKIGRTVSVLFVHSAGNDGDDGHPPLSAPLFIHSHADDNGNVLKEVFCYSQNGSGNDCPSPCSSGATHCETTRHPTYGPYQTVGPTGSLKNVMSIGAVDQNKFIGSFSSRGPTHDGRIKPDVVAKGVLTRSTAFGGGYITLSGTSMSAPVITGISALLTEQWRKSFGSQNPLPIALKTLIIAGADDLGNPGPDYTFGFGLANAQASADLIIADGNTGSRIRIGDMAQGQQIETPLTVTSTQNIRVVVGWVDPEVVLAADSFAEATLVNDLDLKIIDPSGNAVFPYVLDKNNPSNPATRGVNTVDNTEEVEIANAAPGTYRVLLNGTRVATGPTQQYVLIANAALGPNSVGCSDPFEPNDSEATAYGYLLNGNAISAGICSATDVDFYKIRTALAGPLSISVTATDTPLRVTLSGNGITPVVANIAAGATGTASAQIGNGIAVYIVKVEPAGALGINRGYTLVPSFNFVAPLRHRATHH